MLTKFLFVFASIATTITSANALERNHWSTNTTMWNEDGRGYTITAVQRGQRPEEAPWLFYATSRSTWPLHKISFSSRRDERADVFIDGRGFQYVEGIQQIVTRRDGKMVVRKVKRGSHRSLEWINEDFLANISISKIQKALAHVFRENPAAEPSVRSETSKSSSGDG